jgi:hypothetical protein
LLTATKGAGTSVIFMAFDGVPRLGFIINGAVKKKFIRVSDLIMASGIRTAVKTYEPQINDMFFEQNKGRSSVNVNVIKPQNYEEIHSIDICDGNIISTDALDLAEAICLSSKIADFRKTNKRINVFIVIWSILISCILAAFVAFDFFDVEFFALLRSHITTIFNVLIIANLIPAIIEIILIKKNNPPSK